MSPLVVSRLQLWVLSEDTELEKFPCDVDRRIKQIRNLLKEWLLKYFKGSGISFLMILMITIDFFNYYVNIFYFCEQHMVLWALNTIGWCLQLLIAMVFPYHWWHETALVTGRNALQIEVYCHRHRSQRSSAQCHAYTPDRRQLVFIIWLQKWMLVIP